MTKDWKDGEQVHAAPAPDFLQVSHFLQTMGLHPVIYVEADSVVIRLNVWESLRRGQEQDVQN